LAGHAASAVLTLHQLGAPRRRPADLLRRERRDAGNGQHPCRGTDGREHPADRGRGDQALKTGGLRIDLSGGVVHGPTASTTRSLASRSASIAARPSRSAPRT